jgi:hypothetical protein
VHLTTAEMLRPAHPYQAVRRQFMSKRKPKRESGVITDDDLNRLPRDLLKAFAARVLAKAGKTGEHPRSILPSQIVASLRRIFPQATAEDIENILRGMEQGPTPREIAAQVRAETETIKCTVEFKDAVVETELKPQEIADRLDEAIRWSEGPLNPPRTDDVLNLARWNAVDDVLRNTKTISLRKAYEEASKRLKGSKHAGSWSAMRKSYRKIEGMWKRKWTPFAPIEGVHFTS